MHPNELSAPNGSIQEKISAAHDLFRLWGNQLRADSSLRDLMARLEVQIQASRDAMVSSGIVSACRECEEEDGGSCCGAGIEDKYDPVLLAMNLLMGAQLPGERELAGSCFFLGRRGCKLKARQVLCVNYLCLPVQKKLGTEALIRVQKIVGEELDTIFFLKESIKKCIAGK